MYIWFLHGAKLPSITSTYPDLTVLYFQPIVNICQNEISDQPITSLLVITQDIGYALINYWMFAIIYYH